MILLLFFLILLFQDFCRLFSAKKPIKGKARNKRGLYDTKSDNNPHSRNQKKPAWVVNEVIRLRALSPKLGCGKIADIFNRLYLHTRDMTVCKGTVYNITCRNKYAIFLLAKKIKHQKPIELPHNFIWSIDLTTITNADKKQQCVFGVIDNGSRACLLLQNIGDKSAITLLRCLLDIIERYGKPKKMRMDNEPVFKSNIFRFGLWVLGVKQQFTDIACPWMNGRIERLFGTLKSSIKNTLINSTTLGQDLLAFRFWYNHVRTHNNLNGKTPAEAWNKTTHNIHGKVHYVNLCNGELTGFYLPPE